MYVRDVMTHSVACVRPKDTIAAAAELMRDLDVGVLPVCDDDDRLLGIITDRDITIRATADAMDPSITWVRDIMSPNMVACFEDQDVFLAAERMKTHQVRRLVVLNRDKRLAGIVSLGDVAVDTGNRLLAGEMLEAISEPVHCGR